jgi:hypothetical protein
MVQLMHKKDQFEEIVFLYGCVHNMYKKGHLEPNRFRTCKIDMLCFCEQIKK